MSICVDKKRGTFYISYKYKTPLGETKTVNIKNKDWKISGTNKVSKRYLASLEQSLVEDDKKKRGINFHEGDDITLKEALELYLISLKTNGLQDNSIYAKKSSLITHLLPLFKENSKVDKVITIQNMSKVKDTLFSQCNITIKTKNIALSTMRDFVKFLKKRKYISRDNGDDVIDILNSIRDTSVKFDKPNYLLKGDEDVNKFFASFEQEDKEWLIYFQTLFYSALRIGEFSAITYNDIDFDNNTISITKQITNRRQVINRTKNGHDKVVLLPTQLMALLKDFTTKRCYHGDDLVFTSVLGKMLNRNSFQAMLDKHCNMAEVNRITLHGLRHTFATRMIDRNYSVQEIQKQLGHTSMNTTMNFYIHYTENKDKNKNDNLF